MDSASKASSAPVSPNVDRVKMVLYAKSTARLPVLGALVQQLEAQKGRLEYDVLQDCSEVFKAVEKTTMTVLIISLQQKDELIDVLNILGQVQSRVQSGLLRAMVINGMNHPRVLALLKAKGVQEIIENDTHIKALNHKIKNAFLFVTQAFQRLHNQNIRASTVVGGDGRPRTPTRNESSNEIQWAKSVEHAGDFWWIPSAKNLRNVMGRWLIDMLGPGPAAGYWEETRYERNGEKGWVWKIRVSTDRTFMPKPGRWLFFGRQPEFVWQKNLWSFVSKMPYLAFYGEGQSESEFIRIDSVGTGRLLVFENSEVSRTYLPKIQASLEASLKLSTEGAKSEIRGNFEPKAEDRAVPSVDFLPSGIVPPIKSGNKVAPVSPAPDAAPVDWKDHTGAVGVGFDAKDLRLPDEPEKAKWRNALSAKKGVGGKLGLEDIKQSGLVSGAKSFDKMVLEVRPLRRNGVEIAAKTILRVIELTKSKLVFEYPRSVVGEKDKFQFNIEFRLADVEKKFELELFVESVESIDGAGSLVQGVITGGALVDLADILKLVAQRQLELKDFFLVAKGA